MRAVFGVTTTPDAPNGKGRSATSQDGPCAVTQRVEGGHVFYLGKSGVEY